MSTHCPYCLSQVKFVNLTPYVCASCKSTIPRGYVEDKIAIHKSVGIIGFTGHGKTVYLTSLFDSLSKLSAHYSNFYFRSLDDFTHNLLYVKVAKFRKGVLPDSTPANFPNPALINFNNVPVYNNSYVSFYDTAGETYANVEQIHRNGIFVQQSNTLFFVISISDVENVDDSLSMLLDTYIRATYDTLGVNTKEQNLIIILTKADKINLSHELKEYLSEGTVDWYYNDMESKIFDIHSTSFVIENFLTEDLKCNRFVKMSKDNFKNVYYTVVAAAPETVNEGLRVLDPFFLLHYIREEKKVEKNTFLTRLKNFFKSDDDVIGDIYDCESAVRVQLKHF